MHEVSATGNAKGTPTEKHPWIDQDEKTEIKRDLQGAALDCNLILKSKRRRKENITQALSTESKGEEAAVEVKGKCMERSQAFNIAAQWLLSLQITWISPQGTMCFSF